VSGRGSGGGTTTSRTYWPVVRPRRRNKLAYMKGRRERFDLGGGVVLSFAF
jgi:hypothetical protein